MVWTVATSLLACGDDAPCWRLAPLAICDASSEYDYRCDGCGTTFYCGCSNVDGACRWRPVNVACDCLTEEYYDLEKCPSD